MPGDLGGTVIPGGYQMDGVRLGPGVSDAMDYNPTDEAGASRAQKYQDADTTLSSKGANVAEGFLKESLDQLKEQTKILKANERARTPPVIRVPLPGGNLRPPP